MARASSRPSLADIKRQVRIEAIIGTYVPLTRHGRWYTGRCPFHDDHDPSLVVWPETQTWKCMSCSPMRGDVLDFVARIEHLSLRAAAERVVALGHVTLPDAPSPERASLAPSRAPVSARHATYTALLAAWGLAARHRADLEARGLTPLTIATAGFATAQPGPAPVTPEADGVPGFFQRHHRWYIVGPAGLAIPVRDVTGSIVAIHLRTDRATHGKYRWLSSGGRPRGAASGAPVHVVPGSGTVVWITEGPLKAIVAGQFLGVPMIGVPGVGAWHAALDALTLLHPTEVVLAFDRDPDPDTAAAVQQHVQRFAAALRERQWPCRLAFWSGPKGLDDALKAGAVLRLTNPI